MGGGIPLLLGISIKIRDFYLTSNWRYLVGTKDIYRRLGLENPSTLSTNRVKLNKLDLHLNYSFGPSLDSDKLDLQIGLGMGYRDFSFINSVEYGGYKHQSFKSLYVSLRLLQARILLSPSFFIFINNDLNADIYANYIYNISPTTYNKKIQILQYELATGIALTF